MKQLVPYGSGTLLQNAVEVAASIVPVEIIVVTGANAIEVQKAAQHALLRWVHNPRWSAGLGSSIAIGAASIDPDSSGLLILLCDQWRIMPQDLLTLLDKWVSAPDRIVVAESGGVNMPPVIFPSSCFAQIRKLKGSLGARSLFDLHPALITAVTIANAGIDLDSQAHLELLKNTVCNN